MNVHLKRTNGADEDFLGLIVLLDEHLDNQYPGTRDFFGPLNKVNSAFWVVVAYDGTEPIACGALKRYDDETLEVKRVFVREEYRGKGASKLVMGELEKWAAELDARRIILETGERQVEAVSLYKGRGFSQIPNYGEYVNSPLSLCMAKEL